MNFDQFAKTLGPAATPDTSNPLGASNAGIIGNYLKSAYLTSEGGRTVGAGTAQAQVAAQNAQAQADFAKKQQIQDLSDKATALKNAGDPSKFQRIGKADGGFDFLDGAGNPITVQQYAAAKGTSPSKVLANSDNSVDKQYVAHYKLTQSLVEALVNGDAKARDKIFAANPGLKEATHGLTGQQIVQQFQQAYPQVYGGGTQAPAGQSLGQDLGGQAPQPKFNILQPNTYGPAASGLYHGLASTLSGG